MAILLIPKLENYKEVVLNPTIYNNVSAPTIEYAEKDGFGVLPKSGSQCWINIECIQSDRIVIYSERLIYKIFTLSS
jgi:hypothetical protein